MNNDAKKRLLNHAEHELELINLKDLPVGKAILTLLNEASDFSNNDVLLMRTLSRMVFKLVEFQLLSPITENDFEDLKIIAGVSEKKKKCVRRESVYVDCDNKIYDDKAVVYKRKGDNPDDTMYIYQGKTTSKKEVTLPYTAEEEVVYLDDIN